MSLNAYSIVLFITIPLSIKYKMASLYDSNPLSSYTYATRVSGVTIFLISSIFVSLEIKIYLSGIFLYAK